MMNKSFQVMASKSMTSAEAAEWIYLLVLAKEAGVPIEPVRSFLQGRALRESEQASS
ncbi:hypothetical protein D3C77_464010 [compost metagenome]